VDGGYNQGDTLGCLIDLPDLPTISTSMEEIIEGGGTYSDLLPPSNKEHNLIQYKHNMFLEVRGCYIS
jgi:hypothetical protein